MNIKVVAGGVLENQTMVIRVENGVYYKQWDRDKNKEIIVNICITKSQKPIYIFFQYVKIKNK